MGMEGAPQDDEEKLTFIFNGLSRTDKVTLYAAVAGETLTRVAREDTQRNRWFFPLYAIPIVFILAPIPIPGANSVPLALTLGAVYGWAVLGLTPDARRNHAEFKKDFSRAAMVARYEDSITADPQVPGRYQLRNVSVAWRATKEMGRNTWVAMRYFFGGHRQP